MEKQSQNPMAVEPIPRLMARIGTPIVLSMILQAAYNVVDSAYLARMADGGEAALTALSLAFPVQLFMVAVSIGTGVGTNALLARLLGQGDREQANRTVGNAQFIALCITVVFMLFAAVGVRPYVYSQSAGGSIGRDILESAIAYLHICCGVPVGIGAGGVMPFSTPSSSGTLLSKPSPAALNCKPKPALRRAMPIAAVWAHSRGETVGFRGSYLREAVASDR